MSVIIDTGPLAAYANPNDPLRPRAVALMRRILGGSLGIPIALDLVMAELLTLLQKRSQRKETSEAALQLLQTRPGGAPLLNLRHTDSQTFQEATRLHLMHYDRGLSLADAAIVAHATALGASVATFDRAFDGLVPVIAA